MAEGYITSRLTIQQDGNWQEWFHLVCCLSIQRKGLCRLTMALSEKEGLGMGGREGRVQSL